MSRSNIEKSPGILLVIGRVPGALLCSILFFCVLINFYNKKIQRLHNRNRWIYGPSGENRTHGLLNPIVLLSKTQWTLRYHLYAVSSNFKIILSFCFVRCQDVLFLLWSNCGQPTLTNDHSPLLSYMAQFRFSKIEIALFCLHELFIRRICQPCQ